MYDFWHLNQTEVAASDSWNTKPTLPFSARRVPEHWVENRLFPPFLAVSQQGVRNGMKFINHSTGGFLSVGIAGSGSFPPP